MKAVHFSEKEITLIEKPRPEPKKGEVLLRPILGGICNTDLELKKGYYNFTGTPGHEFVALVEKAPDKPELEGKRVVSDINLGCGNCRWCQKGDPRHCSERRVLGIKGCPGAFAEFLAAPMDNLHLVDPSMKNEHAVFAEPLAAALEISQQVHLKNSLKALVMGDGKLGLLAALGLSHFLPEVTLLGKHQEKLNIAKKQGVNTVLFSDPDQFSQLRRKTGSFDLVVEATGSEKGLDQALMLVEPRGTIVAKTTSHKPSTFNLAGLVVNEVRLLGSRCGDLSLALAFLKNKWIDVEPLIEAVFPFSQFERAFSLAAQPGSKKVLIDFS